MKGLSEEKIIELLAKENKKGRPLLRDKWGELVNNALRSAGPEGLSPRDLQDATDLRPHQIGNGARWLRDHTHDGPPVVYVPRDHRWYSATSRLDHAHPAMRELFLQRAATMVQSAERLAAQCEEEWPEHAHEFRRLIKDADRVREDVEDLVGALS